ncbi:MAG: thiamine diphosphokinase [Armatimonadetes bacterium]|nr:thiamine diphosphokinase [Armatimonadota bacterium]
MLELSDCVLFIAADGAADHADSFGLLPDAILGDFDSLSDSTRAAFPAICFVSAPSQDAADSEKAVQYATEHGVDQIVLLGALGGRLDHTLANLSLLVRYEPTVDITILEEWGGAAAVGPMRSRQFQLTLGDTISVLPIMNAAVVSLKGTKWPLSHERLEPGTRGVSNVAVSNPVEVAVEDGVVLVVWSFATYQP